MTRSDRRYLAVLNSMREALKRGYRLDEGKPSLEILAEAALSASNLKLYQCSACNKKFRNGHRLHEHLKSTGHLRPRTRQKG